MPRPFRILAVVLGLSLLFLRAVEAQGRPRFSAISRISPPVLSSLVRSGDSYRLTGSGEEVHLRMPTRGGERELIVRPHDIRSPDYYAAVDGGNSRVFPQVQLFRGVLAGDGDSFVRLSYAHDGVMGIFRAAGILYSVTSNPVDRSIVAIEELNLEDLGPILGTCAAHYTPSTGSARSARSQRTLASNLPVLQVATEADFQFVAALGSASAAFSRILSLLNGVDGIYQVELGLTVSVTYQHGWTSPSDPYPLNDSGNILDRFRNYWEANLRPGRIYDVAHLWSGKDFESTVVGKAYLGTVCGNEAYSISQRIGDDGYDVPLSAHEIAHNLGAEHDACAGGDPWVMCPFLAQNVHLFSPGTKAQVAAVLGNVSCVVPRSDPPPTPVQRPPVLDPIGPQSVMETSTVQFTVSATDPNGDALSYAASGLPSGATFADRTFSYSPDYDAVRGISQRRESITVTVTDTTGRNDSETFTLTVVNANRLPTFSAVPTKDGAEGSPLSLALSASDPDGDPLAFLSQSTPPPGATVLPTGSVVWRPAGNQAGTYTLTLSAVDPFGGSDTQSFQIVIADVPGVADLPARHAAGDLDGNGRAGGMVYRRSTGEWRWREFVNGSLASPESIAFGLPRDIPILGDFDGDHISDLALFRPAIGRWFIRNSGSGVTAEISFGESDELPAIADYDADGRTDVGLFRPVSGTLRYLRSANGGEVSVAVGQRGDVPVSCDYSGDGAAEPTVYRPRSGEWISLVGSVLESTPFGEEDDLPLPADYDGDGRCDRAVLRPREGAWYVRSERIAFGRGSDIPLVQDYDGDGAAEISSFRLSDGSLHLRQSDGSEVTGTLGEKTDVPVATAALFYNLANAHSLQVVREAELLSAFEIYRPQRKFLYTAGAQGSIGRPVRVRGGTYITRGDYNGDGRADEALFLRGRWSFFYKAGSTYRKRPDANTAFGAARDQPVAGDFDGDGKTDIAVYRSGQWFVSRSRTGRVASYNLGQAGDRPIAADYNGDGRADPAVWRPAEGRWIIVDGRSGETLLDEVLTNRNAIPRAADFDGDGRSDRATWMNGNWTIYGSTGATSSLVWGAAGDVPLLGYFISGGSVDLAFYRPTGSLLSVRSADGSATRNIAIRVRGKDAAVGIVPFTPHR